MDRVCGINHTRRQRFDRVSPSLPLGALTPLTTVAIPAGPGAFYGALDPTSTHLYTANTNSISVFTIACGALTLTATTTIAGSQTLGALR